MRTHRSARLQLCFTLLALLAAPVAGCTSSSPTPGQDVVTGDDVQAIPGVDVQPGTDAAPNPNPPLAGLYTARVTEVVLEVDYQQGAEPYTGAMLQGGDTWDLFRENARALFAAAPRTLTVPTALGQMEQLTDITGQDFTVDQILAIAARHRQERDTDARRSFYVVWLEGYFSQDGARQAGVLGVSLGNTGVIAMFKPVIRSTGTGIGTQVERFVEQTTLVHEFGHAVGLVNNGVPVTTAHQDTAHGAHCSNRDCVMYYLNEGANDAVQFVTRRVTGGTTILFGDECLADTRAAAR